MSNPLDNEWDGLRVVVAGIGISGFACADALLERGAQVVIVDVDDTGNRRERGTVLEVLGADIRFGAEHVAALPEVGAELLVVSPGWTEENPVVRDALAAGIPVWSEAELAWRLRPARNPAPWLTITGTRGKATTATMLATMLSAAGKRATSTGQAGTSLLESVLHPEAYDVLAVQLSDFQLRWSSSLRPLASVCLNVGPADPAAGFGRIYENTEIACVYNLADPATEELVREADVIEGARAIGFSGGVPAVSMLGLVEDVLCDRAFVPQRSTSAAELGTTEDVRTAGAGVLAAHNVLNALAAASLARAYGVAPSAVRDGLRHYYPLPHRLNLLARSGEIDWVDDSAATDAFAAAAGLSSFESVVWIAGGYGDVPVDLDAVVQKYAGRLRGVVLLPGEGTAALREALGRHAPDVPVSDSGVQETVGMPEIEPVMRSAVERAAELARPGDTVLLSPVLPAPEGEPFSARGQAFAAAVKDVQG
ncbi:UDP-N-acetylmuramoyl-L-alanine--D-glutamate ligase [Kineosporia rhizophila]|uniref:Mur ligase family protein n=1 Tax=Kineosporia TaxID=49184 RepID=UPI001E3D18A7|nr:MULTISPECIES: Mur ligase family protein [Kineosporia]MCE0538365.1 UDP-N-acetylmuramoyl-L-alanine--D-glutamate ligase [Kineosporia rhizophila]GLY18577.1 UDP-N-acetylmuramoylalanine--D-glutamate ligase [Kineosporia sp. NBRC 101677]